MLADGTIKENFRLSDLKGKYVVLFFYPLDFTFVCPTEIIAHDKRIGEFKKRKVEVVCVSIDSQFTHFAMAKHACKKRRYWYNTVSYGSGCQARDYAGIWD